ncbi:hypothetical protein CTAYLR_009901 [Chrysophaeum taylorii]|uniref:U-box domain-containing protein n=1 Tax=Chrysophaeum taylorii TaxID=2483200 RepID=A0AAD7XP00_9STRA|nr:hypothetical protein CTAYLR_009901 [Chrysophaeum taylorii]
MPRLLRIERCQQGASDASGESSAVGEAEAIRQALEALQEGGPLVGNEEVSSDAGPSVERARAFPWPDATEMARFEREHAASASNVVIVSRVPRVPLSLVSSLRASLREVARRAGRGGVEVCVPFDPGVAASKPLAFVTVERAEDARRVARIFDGASLGALAGRPLQRGASPRMAACVLSEYYVDEGESKSSVDETSEECEAASSTSAEGPADDVYFSGTLASLRGGLAGVLAGLERDLDRAICEGDARRAAKLEVRISRAYRAIVGGDPADDEAAASSSSSDATRPPRSRDGLSLVERALRARAADLDRALFPRQPRVAPRRRRRKPRRDDDDEARRASRLSVAQAALRSERLRAAALARALRLSAQRGVALVVEARERREAIATLSRRLDELNQHVRVVEDRADRAERRAERRPRRRRRDPHATRADLLLLDFDDDDDGDGVTDEEVTRTRALPPRPRPAAADDATPPAPHELTCPITLALMSDPVVCADGHTYERSAILRWLETQGRSPQTNVRLASRAVVPNRALKALIDKYKHDHDHAA